MICKAKNKQKYKNMMNMISITTLIVALATYIFVVLYWRWLDSNSGISGPMGLGGLIIFIMPILLTFITGIIIVAKRANAQPFLNVVLYIILIIGSLLATVFINGQIKKYQEKISEKARQAKDKTMRENGECLYDDVIYYYNGELRQIYNNSSKAICYVANLDLNVVERDYIKVYKVNNKYTFMLAKSSVDRLFDEWIIYVEDVGYMLWCGSWGSGRQDKIRIVQRIVRSNEYIILDENIHSKFSILDI